MSQIIRKRAHKLRRRARVRFHVARHNSNNLPRLSVFRSKNHIVAQIIDDQQARTLVAASTLEQAIRDKRGKGGNIATAQKIGQLIAERALAKNIDRLVFDRGGFPYHGRLKQLAEAARAGGLKF